jgi:hypothetical protein
MKKIWILICLLIMASNAYGQGMMPVGGRVTAAAGGCVAGVNDGVLAVSHLHSGGGALDTAFQGVKIVLSANSTITGYKASVCNDSAGNVELSLYDDDGGGASSKPKTQITNSGKTISNSLLTNCDTLTDYTFTLTTPISVSAGTYWIVQHNLTGTTKGSYKGSDGDRMTYGASVDASQLDDYEESQELRGCTP